MANVVINENMDFFLLHLDQQDPKINPFYIKIPVPLQLLSQF